MTRLLDRFVRLTTVSISSRGAYDGQGRPSYGTPQDVSARVREASEYLQLLDGSQVRITLDVWLPSGVSVVPVEKDRLTYNGDNYIVYEVTDLRTFKDQRDHIRVRCHDE